MNTQTILLMVLGLALLIAGAEILVRGASRMAAAVGISPLVIGLTVVAFGTSSPEMAVSVSTALKDKTDIAMGNVVGSNIFNVLFILGISAIITPLIVQRQLIRLDVPIMIVVSILALAFGMNANIDKTEGVLLVIGIVAYTSFLIWQSRKETKLKNGVDEFEKEYGDKHRAPAHILLNIGFVVGGLVMLVFGSNWLVDGAVALAKVLGVDDLIIGLTIVAAGTSLPEVATSILAALKGERDIAVGNVVGSNIFNILAVMGLSAIVAPSGLPVASSAITFDIPVMIAVAIACLPIFFTGYTIARWEGVVFLSYYVAYTLYLIFNATQHAALPVFSNVMLLFVLPITFITICVTTIRALKNNRLPNA
jgi:cation:H+ antiporter